MWPSTKASSIARTKENDGQTIVLIMLGYLNVNESPGQPDSALAPRNPRERFKTE